MGSGWCFVTNQTQAKATEQVATTPPNLSSGLLKPSLNHAPPSSLDFVTSEQDDEAHNPHSRNQGLTSVSHNNPLSTLTNANTMKTAKALPADMSSSRRAQPLRQTRTNPPRSSATTSRADLLRDLAGGGQNPDQAIDIFPAITHFADAITALPKELVRHFTLLKEVDAKIFGPEEALGRLVNVALHTPLPERPQAPSLHGLTSASKNESAGTVTGVKPGSTHPHSPASEIQASADAAFVWDAANVPRRQMFRECAYTMQDMLVSLDEKNHVISTATEALHKQMARLDDCFPYIANEVSEEARYGSNTHWAYPENRIKKANGGGGGREAAATILTAAQQAAAEEAAARSEARKQAMEAKRKRNAFGESDFDDSHDARNKDGSKKAHGNTKGRRVTEVPPPSGLANASAASTNGNHPQKRRKVEKAPNGGIALERTASTHGNNGTASKGKNNSPRETPVPEAARKRSRLPVTTNGAARRRYAHLLEDPDCPNSLIPLRNNTVTSLANSPSLASSPVQGTFAESKPHQRPSPGPANSRPSSVRGRQNSSHSVLDSARHRPDSATSNRQNGHAGTGPPDLKSVSGVTGRSVSEIKASMKESAVSAKGEHLLEDVNQVDPDMIGGLVVGSTTTRKESASLKHEEMTDAPIDGAPPNSQSNTASSKSGRASKPSTPAIPHFPDTANQSRGRSARNVFDGAGPAAPTPLGASAHNKRSHKKGAGAAAAMAAQTQTPMQMDDDGHAHGHDNDEDEGVEAEIIGDGEMDVDVDVDEPTYCYCNGVSYGEMVACDRDECAKEWFHLECVGLKVAPKGNGEFFFFLVFPLSSFSMKKKKRSGHSGWRSADAIRV